jgi:hypothetical protein
MGQDMFAGQLWGRLTCSPAVPAVQEGSWEDVSGDTFLRKLLSMPLEETRWDFYGELHAAVVAEGAPRRQQGTLAACWHHFMRGLEAHANRSLHMSGSSGRAVSKLRLDELQLVPLCSQALAHPLLFKLASGLASNHRPRQDVLKVHAAGR